MADTPEATEDAPDDVERLVERASIDLTDDLILRLVYDLAHRIHKGGTIAQRYGFRDTDDLKRYLANHPTIVDQAKRLQAIIESDESTEHRARRKAAFATEELIVPMAHIAGNPSVPAATRIDAFKQLNRVAGVDGMPAAARDAGGGSGTQFNLTINLPTGVEKITTVVDNQPVLGPPADDE